MQQKKLPMSLLDTPSEKSPSRPLLLAQPFQSVFGPKAQRKRPAISVETLEVGQEEESGTSNGKGASFLGFA